MDQYINSAIILWAVPFYIGVISLEVIASYLSRDKKYDLNETISNIATGVVQQVGDAAVNLILIPLYIFINKNYSMYELPSSISIFLLFFIFKDFMYYWVHRLGHENSFLWGIHLIHHQPKKYNYSVGLRMPLFHHIVDVFPMMLAAFLGFSIEVFVIVSVIWASLQILTHTTYVKNEIPIISKIFVTPSHHRVHHGMNKPYINKNYGGIFSFWDKIFETYQKELDEVPVQYGVRDKDYCLDPIEANLIYFRDNKNKLTIQKGFKTLSLSLIIIGAIFVSLSKKMPLYLTVSCALSLILMFQLLYRKVEK